MAHSSPIDEVQISGLNSKTAAEIVDLIRTEIRAEIDASRTKASETHSQPQGTTHRPTFAASSGRVWAAAGTTIAAVALIVGIFQWQLTDFREESRANYQSIQAEFGSIRTEIASVREELKAEIASVRTEIGSVREELKAEIGSVRAE